MWAALRLPDCLHARSERITASVLRSHRPITRLHGMAKMSTGRRLRMRPGASVRSCHASSIRLGHLAGSRPGDVPPYLMRGRSIVVPHCEKSAAVASLEAQTNGLSDHLESVASKMKKSPGQFSATESQDLQDIEEINQENYYQKIEEADAPVVLVDFYTQWCGPCKLMYPQLVAMKGELEGEVTFYKFNCNKANKELGTKLEIKVAPTFILYKAGEEVKRLTGAKIDPLRAAVADLSE